MPRAMALARIAEFFEWDQRDSTCPVVLLKIFLFPSDPNHRLIPRHPVLYEGRFAIVTDVGRDAMDADALLTNSADRGRRSRVGYILVSGERR